MRKSHEFQPTPAMELYAYQRAKLGDDATNTSIAEKVGITRETGSRWKAMPGFKDWLLERVKYYRTPILDLLEQVAIARLGEFKYWEAMAKKFGYIEPEQKDAKQPGQPGVALTPDQMLEMVKAIRGEKK